MLPYKNTSIIDLENELWKNVLGYEGLYQASNLARIKSLIGDKIKILSQAKSASGYLHVTLYKNNKKTNQWVHIVVGELFVDNPYGKPEINHKFGIRDDNRAIELEWSTKSENEIHARNVLFKRNSVKQKEWASERGKLNGKEVFQLDFENNVISTFPSADEAARTLNFVRSCITAVCRGERSQHKGFVFKYKEAI